MKKLLRIFFAVACISAFAACEFLDDGTETEGDGHSETDAQIDSVTFTFAIEADRQPRILDILLYEDTGMRRLSGYRRWSGSTDSLAIVAPEGGKSVIAIANFPHMLNIEALGAYESAELLQSDYRMDSADAPVMSGTATAVAGKRCTIRLKPLLSEITLTRVQHELEGYLRMEDPVIYLSDVPASAELMRDSGFRASLTSSDTTGMRRLIWDALPFDVGMYPQYPGIKLLCYPEEDEVRPVNFTLECTVSGTKRKFTTSLPPIGRNDSLSLELDVNRDLTYKYTIY